MAARCEDGQTTPDLLAIALGERVAGLRDARGLIPSRLAELAGMDPNYLWRSTAGRQNLSLRNIARLAVALNVTLSELFESVEIPGADLGNRGYARKGSFGSGVEPAGGAGG